MIAIRLSCEGSNDPMSVERLAPRLSWTCQSAKRGDRQTAYAILAASTPDLLARDQGDLWDSGVVASDESVDILYEGGPLSSLTDVSWKVRVWDKDGVASDWSKPARFSMGLLSEHDWGGEWIGSVSEDHTAGVMLRNEFALPQQIRRARLCIAGLGYHELYVNGERIGDQLLDPGFTDYDKRALYVVHDVSDKLRVGKNALGVILGSGWLNMAVPDVWGFEKAHWRQPPKMILQLDIELVDGSRQSIVSDETWRVTTDGPITYNTLRGGETYDARLECPGWDTPGFQDSKWSSAAVVSPPNGRLVSQKLPAIKLVETLKPVKMTEPKPGVYVFHLLQNIAGWARITVSGKRGDHVRMVYSERLGEDGLIDRRDIDNLTLGRFATDEYLLKGNAPETWESRFAYHGFQYIEVTGLTSRPTLDALVGCVVHTSVADTGAFSCSNPLLNKLHEMTRWTQLNNMHSIPQDCPHREKNGWMCDGLVSSEEAMMNFDMAAFYEKWLDDMEDARGSAGEMPSIVPSPGWGADNGPGEEFVCPCWGSACVILPWYHYLQYGNQGVLAEHYDMMASYTDYLRRRSDGHIVDFGLGDWLEVGEVRPVRTPVALTGTAYYYHDLTILSRVAEILGKNGDADRFAGLANEVKNAFNARFFDPATKGYGEDSQTAQALPLFLGMVPDEHKGAVVESLVRSIRDERGGHISAGITGVKYVLDALTETGQTEVAYAMVTKPGFPGWVNMLDHSATTMWEAWEGVGSLDHPAFGCVDGWFYRALAGILPDETGPGFKKIIIRPHVVGDLTWVKASYESRRGTIVSEWSRKDDLLTLQVAIPVNTSATVYVPGQGSRTDSPGASLLRTEPERQVFAVEPGDYTFTAHIQ